MASFVTLLLDVGWYVGLVVLAVTLCLVTVSPFVAVGGWTMTIPVSFTVDSRVFPVTALSRGGQEAQIVTNRGVNFETVDEKGRPDRGAIVHIRAGLRFPAGRGVIIGSTILVGLFLLMVVAVLHRMRAVFHTLRDGRPFVRANATRIREIAYGLIAIQIAQFTVALLGNHYAAAHFLVDGLHFDTVPDLNLVAIVHGLIILVIAEVFMAGTRLDEDQSLTV